MATNTATNKGDTRAELSFSKNNGVIIISDSAERPLRRRHRQANKQTPRIDLNREFMHLIQKPMLNRVPPLHRDAYQTEYLAVLCLKDKILDCRKYHMFCCKENFVGDSYARVAAHYRNDRNLKIVNQVTTSSVSAHSLFHSVRKHFSEHQWNPEGTVFSTDPSYTEWKLLATINEIQRREMQKFINYVLFLRNT